MKNILNKKTNNRGYTLIEILVAISIFVTLLSAPTSFFIASLRAQQKALYSQELIDNMSYLLEYMGRTIRMAKKDKTASCITQNLNYELTRSGTGIKFQTYRGECQEFYVENDKLMEVRGTSMHVLNPQNIGMIRFRIGPSDSWDQNDDLQPRVTLYMEAVNTQPADPSLRPRIRTQINISQRNLDVNQ